MILHPRIPCDILDIAASLGGIQPVVDATLAAIREGILDPSQARSMCGRPTRQVTVTVTDPTYVEMITAQGARCNTLSLGRLVAYYIDSEMYTQRDWTTQRYVATRLTDARRYLAQASASLLQAASLVPEHRTTLSDIIRQITTLEEEL